MDALLNAATTAWNRALMDAKQHVHKRVQIIAAEHVREIVQGVEEAARMIVPDAQEIALECVLDAIINALQHAHSRALDAPDAVAAEIRVEQDAVIPARQLARTVAQMHAKISAVVAAQAAQRAAQQIAVQHV